MPWDGRTICAPDVSFSHLLLNGLEFDEAGINIFCSDSPLSTPPSTPPDSPTLIPSPIPEIPEHLGSSSSSEFISHPITSSLDTAPHQKSQRMHAKRRSKDNRRVKRKAERELAKRGQLARDYKPRPSIGRNHAKGRLPLKTNFDRRKLSITETGYTGLRDDKSATEYPLEQLVGPNSRFKMKYVAWNGK